MTLAPWEYLFTAVQPATTSRTCSIRPGSPRSCCWSSSIVLYNVRTRALHRHPPYLDMWEWLWWTGLITFSLLDHRIAVRVRLLPGPRRPRSSGSATLVWIRFVRFPPFLAAYETRLARERYFTKQKFADPEATIRKRRRPPPASAQRRRRR